MTNGHKKRMIGRDEEMDRDVLGNVNRHPQYLFFVFCIHLQD